MDRISNRLGLALLICCFFVRHARCIVLEGLVVNSATNQPVPNVDLDLICVKARFCHNLEGKTSSDGYFSFNHYLPAGKYMLSVRSAPGLVATRVSQIPLDLDYIHPFPTIVLKLDPESSLSGTVTDEQGRPKPDAVITAFRQSVSGTFTRLNLSAKATTDKDGLYVFHGLAPGNYYVVTVLTRPNTLTPQNRNQPLDSFFLYAPSALNLEDALSTHVEIGQNYRGVDLHLRPITTYRIQGQAQMDTPGQNTYGKFELHIYPRDSSGMTASGREILLATDGSFQANVLPGLYTLKLIGVTTPQQPQGAKSQASPMVHLLSRQDIEITGKGLYGIVMLIPSPATIQGHIFLEGSPDAHLGFGAVTLKPLDPIGTSACQGGETGPDGTFVIANCDSTSYTVHFTPPAGTYVKKIAFNGRDALTQPVDLSRCCGGNLTISLRPGAASIQATVQDIAEPVKALGLVVISQTAETGFTL